MPSRREVFHQAAAFAGCGAAGVAAGFTSAPARATVVSPNDRRLKTAAIRWPAGPGRELHGYMAIPARAHGRQRAVMIVHDAAGLTEHVRDVARQVALAGYVACAPDLMRAPGAVAGAERPAGHAADPAQALVDAAGTVTWLGTNRYATGKVGAIGFGWGGALVAPLAVAIGDGLAAGVSYGSATAIPTDAPNVRAAMLLHLAGLDMATEAAGLAWADALKRAGIKTEAYVYDGARPGFEDETATERYDAAAAALAWQRTLAFLSLHLA